MGISEVALGGVLLAIPLGQLVSLPLAGWLVARQGSRRVVLWGVGLYAAALLGLAQGAPRAWLQGGDDAGAIEAAITARLAARAAKNWAEADRIRAELVAQGVVLEDSAAGTTWKRA